MERYKMVVKDKESDRFLGMGLLYADREISISEIDILLQKEEFNPNDPLADIYSRLRGM